MDATRSVLLAISIILFAMGAWPIAILTMTVFITMSTLKSSSEKKNYQALVDEINSLKNRVEKLENREEC